MSVQIIQGTKQLGESIKRRRQELGLTIEEAASKARVGIKTWCRYEAGESIRRDKVKGVCKTLNWNTLSTKNTDDEDVFNPEYYYNHEAWSEYISKHFGQAAAIDFIVGSDIVLDFLDEDLHELSKLPKETHIGELPVSMIKDLMPQQFLMRYDYEFLYLFRAQVKSMRNRLHYSDDFLPQTVMEELILYICNREAEFLMETMETEMEEQGITGLDRVEDWVFELITDADIEMWLYSDICISPDNGYHFEHWTEVQFYSKRE